MSHHRAILVLTLAGFSTLLNANAFAAEKPSLPKIALTKTDVFESGKGGYFSYRIPALITAPDGSLLVFCEGRKSSRSDDGDIDMLLRRSTDHGKTGYPCSWCMRKEAMRQLNSAIPTQSLITSEG
jgi:hypothetical protein